jgi:hypothetical protein
VNEDNENEEPRPDDEELRRKRAAELHEQIERLKSSTPPDQEEKPRRPPSPREFTEHSAHEETEDEQADADDDS